MANDLSIAYSIRRKAKKKMADGGPISAKTEKRPSPSQTNNDKVEVSLNHGDKAPKHDSWTDRSTETQAQSNSGRAVKPIKRPRMVATDAFSTRLYDKEGHLEDSAKPASPDEQPDRSMNEEGPDRHGPKIPDMAKEHSTMRKAYAKGGEIQNQPKPKANKYEDDLLDLGPSHDEGDVMAMSHDEADQDMQGGDPDEEHPHNQDQSMAYARGGHISPDDEISMDDEDSIAAAIMAKRDRHPAAMSDSDIDEMIMLYEGGEILSHDSINADDSDQADLSRNHDEDANEEDQLSFNALRKENYNDSDLDIENPKHSGQIGDSREMNLENAHDDDMVSEIRRRMKKKQIPQR